MQRRQLIQNIFYSSLIPPYQSFFFFPDRRIKDLPNCIEGQLPQDLRGTLYRVGPFLFSSSDGERYGHWFDGDGGVVNKADPKMGRSKGALQLIQTPYLSQEQEKQRRIYFGDSPAPNAILNFYR